MSLFKQKCVDCGQVMIIVMVGQHGRMSRNQNFVRYYCPNILEGVFEEFIASKLHLEDKRKVYCRLPDLKFTVD